MSHPTSFTSLPEELQVMVASYLSQHDTAICLRVCQAWRRIFTPFVWRHIEAKFYTGRTVEWEIPFMESARSGSLKTYGRWIQSIDLNCDPDFIEEFLDLSPETFPRLTSLSFKNPKCEILISSFIEKAAVGNNDSGLKTLEIYGFDEVVDVGCSSVHALLEHASTLEVVRLDKMSCLSSDSIQEFLCSAFHLKEFDVIGDVRDPYEENLFLDAHDVVSQDWVCTELEVFGCPIRGIPRPDITEIAGEPANDFIKKGTKQESLDLQRGVYSQLGRLKKLRELSLGVSVPLRWGDNGLNREREYQHDCLAMTVESGLDLLKDLKELEIVVLREMDVFISHDGEEAWVKKNWPKVNRIYL
ncbi:hypothetical protein F5H01DRAFT_409427 [Linnemannia elongata]|nr:hypothetical protein F5H01DRAFT_409427 [Linnemannia elongata]